MNNAHHDALRPGTTNVAWPRTSRLDAIRALREVRVSHAGLPLSRIAWTCLNAVQTDESGTEERPKLFIDLMLKTFAS